MLHESKQIPNFYNPTNRFLPFRHMSSKLLNQHIAPTYEHYSSPLPKGSS